MNQEREDYDDEVIYLGQITKIDFMTLRDRVRELERRVDGQSAVIAGLAQVLCGITGTAEAELVARVQAAISARHAAPVRTCEKCGRPLGWKRPQCAYCEAPAPPRSVADLLSS
ncbi:MAG TPA: hypothetical protein VKD90_12515 [Gemmataceae bacterium]|nr:hypothetical protein [Gemmataceae bacterium]